MPSIDCVVESPISRSTRARQIEALFDVPAREKTRLQWIGKVPIEDKDWNVGLIVGPSGSGKSTIAKHLYPAEYHVSLTWQSSSVIDDVRHDIPVQKITDAFSAVGFNTIPAWLRPHEVLSNGERFRVDIARRMLELNDPIVVDEFTSVVDRQVAQIASHAVQKYIRKNQRKLIAVTCHYDVIEWLQPDWILEPANMMFQWRSLQQRPTIDTTISPCTYETWQLFAPYHYLTAELNKAARCFALYINNMPVSFVGILHMPHFTTRNLKRVSRAVTLPDWQGLGLGFVLMDTIGAAYRAAGARLRTYPAHPSFVRSFGRSPNWIQVKRAGKFSTLSQGTVGALSKARPCAVFEYVGRKAEKAVSDSLLCS